MFRQKYFMCGIALDLHQAVPRPLGEHSKGDDNAHTFPVSGGLDQAQPANIRSYFPIESNGGLDFFEFIHHKGILSVR
jgi:hypothetical protein